MSFWRDYLRWCALCRCSHLWRPTAAGWRRASQPGGDPDTIRGAGSRTRQAKRHKKRGVCWGLFILGTILLYRGMVCSIVLFGIWYVVCGIWIYMVYGIWMYYVIWMCYGIWMYMVLYMVWFFQIPYQKVATSDIFINDCNCKWSSYVHMPQIGLGWHIFKTYRWHDQTCANGLESFFATGCACLFWAKTCNTPPGCYCLFQDRIIILEWLGFLMARSFLAMKTWDMRAVHGFRRSIGWLRSVWRRPLPGILQTDPGQGS